MDFDSGYNRVRGLLDATFTALRTALRPDKSVRWYDRIINVVGAIILISILLGIVYFALRGPQVP